LDVRYFDKHSFTYLFHEVFAREQYFFDSDTDQPIIFDCGANIGMATLFFKWLYPRSRVVAFEPDPTTFELLSENIERNGLSSVVAHNVALWDEDVEVPFYIKHDESGSLLMSLNPARTHGKEIKVLARKLSEYIEGPLDLLKLDVEGAESRVVGELVHSGKIDLVKRLIVEYHHNISEEPSALGSFLQTLESCGWKYQLNAWSFPVALRNVFQDVLIYGYK
jgi:FkbM family methyltransferase